MMKHNQSQMLIPLKKWFLLFFVGLMSIGAYAQQISVSGIVEAKSDGYPLPGVSVAIKGTTNGTITDMDGKYVINVEKGKTLVYSFIGMEDHEYVVAEGKHNVKLSEGSVVLTDVVVVGFGKQKKATVVGSITSAKGKELLRAGTVTTVSEALTGIMPGVSTMQAAGQPGSTSAAILIRGISSFEGGGGPLILVDGVERDFNDLDPNEVASISVLKDASATAVYGVKGGNGVIIVTTKRGKKGKARVNFSSAWTTKVPTISTNYATNYADNLRFKNIAAINDGRYGSMHSQSEIDLWENPNRDMDKYTYTNGLEEMTGTGSGQVYNINVSGGNDFVTYFTSFGYNYDGDVFNIEKQKDFDPRTYQKRYNFRSNLDFQFTKTTKFSVNLSGDVKNWNGNELTFKANNGLGGGGGNDGLMLGRMFQLPQVGTPYILSDGRLGTEDVSGGNPNFRGFMERQGQYRKRSNRMFSDFILNQDITKNLVFRAKLSYDYSRQYNSSTTQGELYYVVKNDEIIQTEPSDAFKGTPTVKKEDLSNYGNNLYYEMSLRYNKTLGNHKIGALGIFNRRKSQSKINFPKFEEAWAARATYEYKTKYLVEFNGAYNGSENFAEGLRFGFFPSLAAGWIVSEEKFMKEKLPFIEFFKIKYSYGKVGKSNVGNENSRFPYEQFYTVKQPSDLNHGNHSTYGYIYNTDYRNSIIIEGRPNNPLATWETATKQNLGFELSFLKGKVNLNIDLFDEYREDILMVRNSIPDWYGNLFPVYNTGEVKNHGIDVELKLRGNITKSLSYWANANFSISENRIVSRDDPSYTPDYQSEAGKPIGWRQGLLTTDLYQNWNDVFNAAPSSYSRNLQPGDLGFVDYNADGIVDEADRVAIGNPTHATKSGAFSFGLAYKGFSVTAMFNGIFGISKPVDETYLWEYKTNSSANFMMLNGEMQDYWSTTNTGASHPILHLSDNGHNGNASQYSTRKSDFIRLRNLEVKYKFSKRFLNSVKLFDSFEVYVSGSNLATWTSLPDVFDPEANRLAVYPLTRRYNVGLRCGF